MEGMLEGFKDGRMDWKQIRKRKIGEIILLFLNTKVKIASGKLRMCIGGKETCWKITLYMWKIRINFCENILVCVFNVGLKSMEINFTNFLQ